MRTKNITDMTQKEFEERVNGKIAPEDYQFIETLYYAARGMDKDRFCEDFTLVLAYDGDQVILPESLVQIAQQIQMIDEDNNELKSTLYRRNSNLADILIGKAHAHNDTDLYREAIKLVGRWQAVKRTIEMGLPLWDEDKEYICAVLDEQGKKIEE